MARFYLMNLSFEAASDEQAEAVRSEVAGLVNRLKVQGLIIDAELNFGRDWLAVPRTATPLRAAANKLLTTGPVDL